MGRGDLPLILFGGEVVTLQEILDAVMERYPHALSDENIISKINIYQQEMFRTIYKPQTATTYDLMADNPFYPIDFSPETIIDVVVDGTEYPYQNIKYDAQNYYYYITDDNCIGIYPTPTDDVTAGLTVFRYTEPTTLTTDYLDLEPDLDRAFHMLLVYRACKDVAEIALDTGMANQFISQYNSIERALYKSSPAKPHKILDVYGGCWY